MKIYVAAMYSQRDEMMSVKRELEAAGHVITARWINGAEEDMTREQGALMDLADVASAEVLVAYTLKPKTLFSGGGRHVETGYALALGKRVLIVGPRENIFHHLPQVEQHDTLVSAMGALS